MRASTSTRATIASTIGTALGRTQGSCRPFARMVTSSPSLVTVFCSRPMVEVGLNATLMTMFSPLEMPPWTPPLRLVLVLVLLSSSMKNSSLWSYPLNKVPWNPDPIYYNIMKEGRKEENMPYLESLTGRERHACLR